MGCGYTSPRENAGAIACGLVMWRVRWALTSAAKDSVGPHGRVVWGVPALVSCAPRRLPAHVNTSTRPSTAMETKRSRGCACSVCTCCEVGQQRYYQDQAL